MYFVLCVFVALATTATAEEGKTEQPAPSPHAILQSIQEKGAQATLNSLWDDDKAWPSVTRGIASGEKAWLDVADRLRSVSDAGASEDLDIARATAIGSNPAAVFRMESFAVEDCSRVNTIDGYPLEDHLRELQRRTHAINLMNEPELRETRECCLRELHKAFRSIGLDEGVLTAESGFSLNGALPVAVLATPLENYTLDSRSTFVSSGPHHSEMTFRDREKEEGRVYRVSFFRDTNWEDEPGKNLVVEELHYRQDTAASQFQMEALSAFRLEFSVMKAARFLGWYSADSFVIEAWTGEQEPVQCLVTIFKDGKFTALREWMPSDGKHPSPTPKTEGLSPLP